LHSELLASIRYRGGGEVRGNDVKLGKRLPTPVEGSLYHPWDIRSFLNFRG
jgi:hypothetical protein